jgi:lysyl-tRNA synthetase class 2
MKLTYIDKEIDLTPPWDRMTMIEAVKKYSGADFEGSYRYRNGPQDG